jgi:alpha,alpha-trehalose-phosphate synthase [UDP-forming]
MSHRLIALLCIVAALSMGFATYQAVVETEAIRNEVRRQAQVLADSQQKAVEEMVESGTSAQLQAFVDRFQNHDRLVGVAVYDPSGQRLAITAGLEPRVVNTPPAVERALHSGQASGDFSTASRNLARLIFLSSLSVYSLPLRVEGQTIGAMGVFYDVSFIGALVLRHAIIGLAQTLLLVAITLLIVRWTIGRPVRRMTDWLRDMRTGQISNHSAPPNEDMFGPLTNEVQQLATSLNTARAAAEEEARLREQGLSLWTPERLRIAVQSKLHGSRLFVVSNREPYVHTSQGGSITWSVPPSGLVTALEPVLRACDGTWVAQATGDADRKSADEHGRLRVPPDHPQYTLRRVWLSEEEEHGFYLGFANEGLWPLCHIAHTRPAFRSEDWNHYRNVNQKFAAALLEEIEGEREPVILVQDYHFALLPRMIKERRPDARVAIFWHIPWPNSEAFGICPWQKELLDGMLGADLIGFHIQAHCNNFLETVDNALESRIDWEHFAVNRHQHLTAVQPFPISVGFNGNGRKHDPPRMDRAALLKQLGVEATYMGFGVDRVDYTKGIPERLRAVERLMELFPAYRGKLTFVQIGAPSRGEIKRYGELMAEVEQEADRINQRFKTGNWRPVVFLNRRHSHEEILPYYEAANFCMVTSLHDGMNLVAKEFVVSRNDEQGVLILSRFTGASHELADALIINPYDTDEMARAIHKAVTMPAEEQKARMERMREAVKEHNVYRWAENLISTLTNIRLETTAPPLAVLPSPRPHQEYKARIAG